MVKLGPDRKADMVVDDGAKPEHPQDRLHHHAALLLRRPSALGPRHSRPLPSNSRRLPLLLLLRIICHVRAQHPRHPRRPGIRYALLHRGDIGHHDLHELGEGPNEPLGQLPQHVLVVYPSLLLDGLDVRGVQDPEDVGLGDFPVGVPVEAVEGMLEEVPLLDPIGSSHLHLHQPAMQTGSYELRKINDPIPIQVGHGDDIGHRLRPRRPLQLGEDTGGE
mmetsp:Transcript_24082/g.54905  ORF Transcript_24082/g.54905 Transcript_24082/m.54905 type:complete len:220 (+) Transcript_24082:73-732(+)